MANGLRLATMWVGEIAARPVTLVVPEKKEKQAP